MAETVLSCTLIVTAPNDFTRRIHDRMPALLGHHELDAWLTGKAGVELLRPARNDLLRMWPVSKRVNVSGRGNDDQSLIESMEEGHCRGLDVQASTNEPFHARHHRNCYGYSERETGGALEPSPTL